MADFECRSNKIHTKSIENNAIAIDFHTKDTYITIGRCIIDTTFIETEFIGFDDCWTVEFTQQSSQGSTIPIISN